MAVLVFIHRNSLLEEKQSELCRPGVVEALAVSASRRCLALGWDLIRCVVGMLTSSGKAWQTL